MLVASRMVSPAASGSLTPAMTSVLWEIADILDERRVPELVDNAVWLEVPATRLRGPGSQDNNRWLRECLERLNELKITGEDRQRGAEWGAVLIAEWHLEKGEEEARLLIPPAAVAALRSPKNFAQIEMMAAHRLPGPARRLYAALADRKHQDQKWMECSLEQLRAVFGVQGRYRKWEDLRKRMLLPALEGIRKFGTVNVTMTPIKDGRKIVAVRFGWRWKSLDEARRTAEETEKSVPYAEQPAVPTAPPLMPGTREDRERNEREWWNEQPSEHRDRLEEELADLDAAEETADAAWAEEAAAGAAEPLRITLVESGKASRRVSRRTALIRREYEAAHPDEPPWDDLEAAP